ncbi:MAG: GNAT family N-acetyltransferase [Fimbriimonadales bacterium]
MKIRRLGPIDAEAAHALRLRALSESPEAFGTTYEEYAALPKSEILRRYEAHHDSFTLGAFEGGSLVGVVNFSREKRAKTRHKGYMAGMFVAIEARGKGVGRSLVLALIDEVKALDGVEQIGLHVLSATKAARSLYLSLGFEICGLERNADKAGDMYYDSEFMVLFLAP